MYMFFLWSKEKSIYKERLSNKDTAYENEKVIKLECLNPVVMKSNKRLLL